MTVYQMLGYVRRLAQLGRLLRAIIGTVVITKNAS